MQSDVQFASDTMRCPVRRFQEYFCHFLLDVFATKTTGSSFSEILWITHCYEGIHFPFYWEEFDCPTEAVV